MTAHHAQLLESILLPASNLLGSRGDLRMRLPFFDDRKCFAGGGEPNVPDMPLLL